jgi:transposase
MNGKPVTPKRRKYDADFKAEVLKMVESGQSVPELSKNLGISESIIYRWQYKSKPVAKEVGKGDSPSALQAENEGLKARLKQTELERDILKKSLSHFQPDDLRLIYQFMQQAEQDYSVGQLCQVLGVSRSAYYAYKAGDTYQLSPQKQQQAEQVKDTFTTHKRRYGSRRLLVSYRSKALGLVATRFVQSCNSRS